MLGGAHRETSHVSSSLDFMATVNEILDLEYPEPSWTVDSKSLLPLLDGRLPLDSPRNKPIGWQYGQQEALTNQTADNTWKMVKFPALGQCATMLPPYEQHAPGPFLFDLATDPTESHDLCTALPARCAAMRTLMEAYMAGVNSSAFYESGCAASP
jgi:hypothetical protein